MPIFEEKKQQKAPESTRRLSEIVIDMLAENVADKDIIATLMQSGLNEPEAKQVFDNARKQFEQFIGMRIDQVVEEKTKKRLEKMMEDLRKDTELQMDLKYAEQKEYANKKAKEVLGELGSVKSELASVKVSMDARFKSVQSSFDAFRISDTNQMLIAIALLVSGVACVLLMLFFFPNLLNYLIKKEPIDVGIILYVIEMMIVGVIAAFCLNFGVKIFMTIKKEPVQQVGLEWIQGSAEEKNLPKQ